MRHDVNNNFRRLWPLAGALLMGCAQTLPPPTLSCPKWPSVPALRTPAPQPSYSERAQSDISTWRQQLTDTLTMP